MGGVLGLVLAFVLPVKWEANALLRIGKLASTAIEPPLQVVDQLKSKSFLNAVLKNLGRTTAEDDASTNLFRDCFKAKVEKSELITLTLKSRSADEVRLLLNAVIIDLKNKHSKLTESTISRQFKDLEAIDLSLKLAKAEVERIIKALDGHFDALNDKDFPPVALLSSVLLARDTEIKDLSERKSILQDQLSPERTYATDILGDIEVSTNPVFSNIMLFAVAGLFIGLLLGMLLTMLKSMGSRRQV